MRSVWVRDRRWGMVRAQLERRGRVVALTCYREAQVYDSVVDYFCFLFLIVFCVFLEKQLALPTN